MAEGVAEIGQMSAGPEIKATLGLGPAVTESRIDFTPSEPGHMFPVAGDMKGVMEAPVEQVRFFDGLQKAEEKMFGEVTEQALKPGAVHEGDGSTQGAGILRKINSLRHAAMIMGVIALADSLGGCTQMIDIGVNTTRDVLDNGVIRPATQQVINRNDTDARHQINTLGTTGRIVNQAINTERFKANTQARYNADVAQIEIQHKYGQIDQGEYQKRLKDARLRYEGTMIGIGEQNEILNNNAIAAGQRRAVDIAVQGGQRSVSIQQGADNSVARSTGGAMEKTVGVGAAQLKKILTGR